MMNSYRHSKGNGKRLFFAVVLVLVIFLIDGVSGGSVRNVLRAGASYITGAGASVTDSVASSGIFASKRALIRENENLRNEVARLQMRGADNELLRQENENLRELVRLAEGEEGITAPVVSSLRASPYGTFLIGAGTDDGVENGSLVVVGDAGIGGFVVGRVESADDSRSLVKAIFAPGEKTEATIDGVGVTVEGRGGGQARAEAPRDSEIQAGDIVISTQFGVRAIGIVGRVEEATGGASQLVYIQLPISLFEIEFVYVLR